MDYKNTNAPKNTITRDMNHLVEPVGNVYETVAIIAKRANQISNGLKKELDAKLQDFSVPQDSLEETFENKEQIEISRSYEKLPKPTLLATQEFLEGNLIYKGSNKDEALKYEDYYAGRCTLTISCQAVHIWHCMLTRCANRK